MKKISIATVFSGIGSIEFALKRLNIKHDIVFACDNGEREVQINYKLEFKKVKKLSSPAEKKDYVDNLYRSKTNKKNFVEESYKANYKIKNNLFFQDICLLDGNDFKDKIDLFVGGSPCQSFSSVGFKKGLDDTRGTLFYEFARLVKEIKPKVFIYENVRNLIIHDKGKTWDIIKKTFNSLGYSIEYDVINASDFGIPQTRRRLFVIGYLDNSKKFIFPEKQILKYKMKDFMLDNCKFGSFSFDETGQIIIKKSKDSIDKGYFLTPQVYKYVMSPGTKNWFSKPEINKETARTLLKTMGNRHRAGVDNYYSCDGTDNFGKVRMLTEREALRLMGFTDDFVQVVSKAQMYRQAGNSIVVDVMMSIVKQIIKNKVWGN